MRLSPFSATAVLLLVVIAALAGCLPAAGVFSPDGDIEFRVSIDGKGRPGYEVRHNGVGIVGWSRLGIAFAGGDATDGRYRLDDVVRNSHDGSWEQPWGERRVVRDRHNEMLVTFAGAEGPDFRLRVRVYDDGVGFRYEFDGDGEAAIEREWTEVNLEGPATAWWQPADGKLRYEHLYRATPLEDMEAAHTPVTLVREDGLHIAVHEAALVDYAAYALTPTSGGGFRTALRPWTDGIAVRTARPFVTPWRTLQIAEDASGLINSNLILNLNEPNALGDVSWVRPGKYAGIWWEMHLGVKTWEEGPRHGATTENARRYIDFAAENGLAGVLVEGWNKGWHGPFNYTEPYDDFDLDGLVAYAGDRGVFLIAHHETYGDVPSYEAQMEAAMDVLADAGIPQVKTGYVADAGALLGIGANGEKAKVWHDSQFHVQHLLRNVRAAAARRIAVNTHEPVKDTGLRRTYPNWLTREGSRGQEFAIWGQVPNPPEHTVVLAHTRMLGGPMDFTPGMFDLHPVRDGVQKRIQTTLAKQLALYVVLYSPMQMVPDLPENYAARPDAFQFIIDVPTDWEESVALDGAVGDFVVIARQARGTGDWYLGAITDEESRDVSVPLHMLEEGVDYIAEIYRDGEAAHWNDSPYALTIERRTVSRATSLELRLAAGGGTAVRFRPQEGALEE